MLISVFKWKLKLYARKIKLSVFTESDLTYCTALSQEWQPSKTIKETHVELSTNVYHCL